MPRLHRLVAPARQQADPALLVLLHGLGSNEEDLFSLAPQLDPRYTVVALRAPRTYAFGGYAWFDVEWTESAVTFDGTQALDSMALLDGELSSLRDEFGVSRERTVVGGFSQGAMMTLGLLARHGNLFGAGMLLSGCVVAEFVEGALSIDVPVFQSHGTVDPVLPVGLGRIAHGVLEQAGAQVSYHEYPMGHEVSYPCLRDASAWLTARL